MAEVFEDKKCAKCGGAVFRVEAKRDEQLYRIVCKNCKEVEYIEDSAEFWDDIDEQVAECKCLGEDGHSSMYITLGFALREDNSKKWLYIGYLCDECKVLGCLDGIKIA